MTGTPKNIVLVHLWLEDGCSQSDDEVMISWVPVNFSIYSELFPDMIYEATWEWLADNTLAIERECQILLRHIREQDGGGALTNEYFEVFHVEGYRQPNTSERG